MAKNKKKSKKSSDKDSRSKSSPESTPEPEQNRTDSNATTNGATVDAHSQEKPTIDSNGTAPDAPSSGHSDSAPIDEHLHHESPAETNYSAITDASLGTENGTKNEPKTELATESPTDPSTGLHSEPAQPESTIDVDTLLEEIDGVAANVDSIQLLTLNDAINDATSIASTDAVHETNEDDLNTLNTAKEEVTEQQLNPDLATFILACQEGNLTIVKHSISNRLVLANDTFSDSITGLHWACINNRLSIVKYLLHNDYSIADPNAIGGDLKATPLHWAARNGLVYIVDYLLSNSNGDPTLKDAQSYNALHLAVHSSNITMVIYILLTCCDANSKHKLYVDEPDTCNRTALHWAAYQGDIFTVNALLKFGADVSKVDNTLFLPIHWAFMKGYKIVLKTLLNAGSDIFAKNDLGKNTFDIAKDMNCYSTWVKVLKESGRDPKNNWAITPSRIEPKVGKLITFFIPYLLLGAVFQICSFGSGYFVPKLFVSLLLIVTVVYITNTIVIPTYLIDDRPLQKSPFLAGIFSGTAFWCIVIFLFNLVPGLFFLQFLTNILLGACIAVFVWAFFKTMFINPGFIPVPADNEVVLSQVKELISLGSFDTDHFCVNSFVRKPLRAKYSKANKHLVARFDHYCPWVYNEIGVRNHKLFITFVYALNLSVILFAYLSFKFMEKGEDTTDSDDEESCYILNDELCYGLKNHHFHFNLLMWTLLQGVWITFLTVVQTFQILKGVTTWEFSMLNNKIPRSSKLNHSTVPRDFSTSNLPSLALNEQEASRSEINTCLNLIGLDQFIMTVKLSLASIFSSSYSSNSLYTSVNNIEIPSDYGMKQNWLDFWVLGEVEFRNVFLLPIEGENNLNGQVVDYYKLYEYPAKNSSQLV